MRLILFVDPVNFITSVESVVADPGFPVGGGGRQPHWGTRRCPTQMLFGKNVCENERIVGGGGRFTGSATDQDKC